MTISNKDELVQFMQTYFDELTDIQYIEIMSSTLGIYESEKPNDLSQLLRNIDEYGAYLETLPPDVETPLFWYDENEKAKDIFKGNQYTSERGQNVPFKNC